MKLTKPSLPTKIPKLSNKATTIREAARATGFITIVVALISLLALCFAYYKDVSVSLTEEPRLFTREDLIFGLITGGIVILLGLNLYRKRISKAGIIATLLGISIFVGSSVLNAGTLGILPLLIILSVIYTFQELIHAKDIDLKDTGSSATPTRLIKGLVAKIFVVATIAVFITTGFFWYREIYSDPKRVFWGAIDNALRTESVSRQVARDTDTQQPDQFLRLHTSPNQAVTGVNKYYQSGDRDMPTLVTETIGVPEADYIRVVLLESTDPSKPSPDISGVKGKWADATPVGLGEQRGQLYSQFALSIVPFGNLSREQRAELMNKMREAKVYDVDYSKVQRIDDHGRHTYSYEVAVNTEKYLVVLKQFAQYARLNQLEDIDPSQYREARPLYFKFMIDVASHQLIATQRAGGEVTRYHAYGLRAPIVQAPRETMSLDELQQKLQSVQ